MPKSVQWIIFFWLTEVTTTCEVADWTSFSLLIEVSNLVIYTSNFKALLISHFYKKNNAFNDFAYIWSYQYHIILGGNGQN